MTQPVILPNGNSKPSNIQNVIISDQIALATSSGLVRDTNEDVVGFSETKDGKMLFIADGHWGDEASKNLAKYYLQTGSRFPSSRQEAVQSVEEIETTLFKRFGKPDMDGDKDRTPESAFIMANIVANKLQYLSYGDCRLMVVRGGKATYNSPLHKTWLGAFSHLGLRERIAVEEALVYADFDIKPQDRVLLFTDGVDECIYEKSTLSLEQIAELANKKTASEISQHILNKVFEHGAEDNVSLLVYIV